MAADDVRDAIEGALLTLWTDEAREVGLLGADESLLDDTAPEVREALDHFTNALLPTVDRIAREAAGEALRDAADGWHKLGRLPVPDWLRARADAAEAPL